MSKIFNKKLVYGLYAVALCSLFAGLVAFSTEPKNNFEQPSGTMDILSRLTMPVINAADQVTESVPDNVFGRPYNNDEVVVVQNYYDYLGSENDQTSSIIFYQDTYMQSSGVSYSLNGEPFEVIAIMDGEVVEVKEDVLLGNIIKIEHSESITSVYQSVSDIKVKSGDTVKKGDVLATSSTSNINKSLNNHLYFELIIDGTNVNPEKYYDKSL